MRELKTISKRGPGCPQYPQGTHGTPPAHPRGQQGFPNSIFDGSSSIWDRFWKDLGTKMDPKVLQKHTKSAPWLLDIENKRTDRKAVRCNAFQTILHSENEDICERSAKRSDATRFKQFLAQCMIIFVNGPQSSPMQRVSDDCSLDTVSLKYTNNPLSSPMKRY